MIRRGFSLDKVELRYNRWFETKDQKELWERRVDNGFPEHISPYSTLIAGIGNNWHPGCYEKVLEMAKFTYESGYQVSFYEEHDRCYNPYDALGIMRNLAYMKALKEGYEFVCLVDNDVMPEPNLLVSLLHQFLPIVSPMIEFPDNESHGLSITNMERNSGLAMVNSVPLSFVLFQTNVFRPWSTIPFWQDSIGADESYHFERLALVGHRPFVDTNQVLKVVSIPHYPLDKAQDRSAEDLNNLYNN